MIRALARLLRLGRRRSRREDGNATIEFVILFPLFMTIFVSSFEAGMLMVRQVMLDRATDITVRALRLGMYENPDVDFLKQAICSMNPVLRDCEANILIELTPVSTTSWSPLPNNPNCVDKDSEVEPVVTFSGGQQNEMMLVRACVLAKPLFPTTGLGLKLPRQYPDHYALVSTAAFVNEPS